MISPVPEVVKQSVGEEAAEALRRWLQEVLENNTVSRDEFRQILTRLEILEHDVSEIRQDFKEFRREVNQRFDLVHERFDHMYERFDHMYERFDHMYERLGAMIKWTVGTLALFGTLVTILLAIGQFVK